MFYQIVTCCDLVFYQMRHGYTITNQMINKTEQIVETRWISSNEKIQNAAFCKQSVAYFLLGYEKSCSLPLFGRLMLLIVSIICSYQKMI